MGDDNGKSGKHGKDDDKHGKVSDEPALPADERRDKVGGDGPKDKKTKDLDGYVDKVFWFEEHLASLETDRFWPAIARLQAEIARADRNAEAFRNAYARASHPTVRDQMQLNYKRWKDKADWLRAREDQLRRDYSLAEDMLGRIGWHANVSDWSEWSESRRLFDTFWTIGGKLTKAETEVLLREIARTWPNTIARRAALQALRQRYHGEPPRYDPPPPVPQRVRTRTQDVGDDEPVAVSQAEYQGFYERSRRFAATLPDDALTAVYKNSLRALTEEAGEPAPFSADLRFKAYSGEVLARRAKATPEPADPPERPDAEEPAER